MKSPLTLPFESLPLPFELSPLPFESLPSLPLPLPFESLPSLPLPFESLPLPLALPFNDSSPFFGLLVCFSSPSESSNTILPFAFDFGAVLPSAAATSSRRFFLPPLFFLLVPEHLLSFRISSLGSVAKSSF